MINEYITKINDRLRPTLKEKRYHHSLGVAYTASLLASASGYKDTEKAFLAGLIHDCAKAIDYDEQLAECEKRGIELTEYERMNPGALCHAKLGAYMAKENFGIEDEEILSAIKYHTTGRPGMTLLEEIIYISDYIEPGRHIPEADLDSIRTEAFKNIHKGTLLVTRSVIDYLGDSGNVDPVTLATFDYYKKICQ